MFDAIIIGSGAAGVFSAYQLKHRNILLVDVGNTASSASLPAGNLYDLKKSGSDIFNQIIGEEFEALQNPEASVSLKLKGPLMKFVTKVPDEISVAKNNSFNPIMSFAKGGLANAWGGGVMRFNDRDLKEFPIKASDLDPYYDALTKHIGITGCDDDLSPYLGSVKDLLPVRELSPICSDLFTQYISNRIFFNSRSLFLGHMRSCFLSRPHRDRPQFENQGQDFFQPNNRSIYHPGYTLDEMVSKREIEYLPNHLAVKFDELSGLVEVTVKNLSDNSFQEIYGRKLLIACGAINSARFVLSSKSDHETKLSILDNPITFIPFLNPFRIGKKLDTHSFSSAELLLMYPGGEYSEEPVQGSIYNLNAPLRADLLNEFPLSMKGNIAAAKYMLPALMTLQLFFPEKFSKENYLQLDSSGSLKIEHQPFNGTRLIKHIISTFRRLRFFSHPLLCKHAKPGESIHYAGTLPMSANPSAPYQTDLSGKLFSHTNVHVMDAATFPHLPSKNLTFTIMANAMRMADLVDQELND